MTLDRLQELLTLARASVPGGTPVAVALGKHGPHPTLPLLDVNISPVRMEAVEEYPVVVIVTGGCP